MVEVPSLLRRLQTGSVTLQEAVEALREAVRPSGEEALDEAFSKGEITAEQYEVLATAC